MSTRKTLAVEARAVARLPSMELREQLGALSRGERDELFLPWEQVRDLGALERATSTPGIGLRDGALGVELFLENQDDQ